MQYYMRNNDPCTVYYVLEELEGHKILVDNDDYFNDEDVDRHVCSDKYLKENFYEVHHCQDQGWERV